MLQAVLKFGAYPIAAQLLRTARLRGQCLRAAFLWPKTNGPVLLGKMKPQSFGTPVAS
jgi:hypothetical protein